MALRHLMCGTATAAAFLAVPAAHAATISVTVTGAAPAKTLTVELGGPTRAAITSSGDDLTVSGLTGDTVNAPDCTPASGETVDCGPPGVYGKLVWQGTNGDDGLYITTTLVHDVEAHGGEGRDDIKAAAGEDFLYGDGGPDTVVGEGGEDHVFGGGGDDENLWGGPGDDLVDGGPGGDTMFGGHDPGDMLDYSSRTAPVSAELDGACYCPAGEQGEGDAQYGFRGVIGGSGDDDLTGGALRNHLIGGRGDDILDGGDETDTLDGGEGNDDLTGGGGPDTLLAGLGDDFVDSYDGAADTSVLCQAGRDLLFGDLVDPYPTSGPDACEVIAPTIAGTLSVSGTPQNGNTLTAVFNGQIHGTASILETQWFRCQEDCAAIPGATSASYTLTDADVGTAVFVGMLASNEAGYDSVTSELTDAIQPKPQPSTVTLTTTTTTTTPPPLVTPSTAPATIGASVRSARRQGRRLRLVLQLRGDVARVRVELRRKSRRVARADATVTAGIKPLTLRARRSLSRGRYVVVLRLTARDGRTRTIRRTIVLH